MLTIKKIELLRREFENVIKEDREREEHLQAIEEEGNGGVQRSQ